MKNNQMPRLKAGVQMSVFEGSSAFFETATLLRKVDGDHLDVVRDKLLPRLNGTIYLHSILDEISPHMDRDEVLAILRELDRAGLLEDAGEGMEPDAPLSVCVLGDRILKEALVTVLSSTASITLVTDREGADLALLATRSLMDPSTTGLQSNLLETSTRSIVFGLDFSGNGFIGPYQEPSSLSLDPPMDPRLVASA